MTDFTRLTEDYIGIIIGLTSSLCTKTVNSSSDIDVLDCTPKDDSYQHLRLRDQTIVQINEKYKIPVLILDFDGSVPKHVRLWPQSLAQRNQFLYLQRTLLSSPESSFASENSDSGFDTVF